MQQNAAPASIRNLLKLAGNAYQKGKTGDVIHHAKQVLALQPRNVKALMLMGEMSHVMGQYEQAVAYFQQAIAEDPNHIDSYSHIALAFEAMERPLEALQYAQRGTQVAPLDPVMHNTVIRLLLRFNMSHMVLDYFANILPLVEKNSALMENYAISLKVNEQREAADHIYQQALAKFRVPMETRLMYETYIPRLMLSQEEIDNSRAKLLESLRRFTKEKAPLRLESLSYMNLFNLAFHNRDNKEINTAFCKMIRACAPAVNFTARHCRQKPVYDGQRKIKLAFLSRYMHEHSVGRCYREMMRYLYHNDAFDVRLLIQDGVVDDKIKALKEEGMQVVSLPKSLKAAQQVIENQELDILIFTDIGMDAMTSYLAMGRFAHYQCLLTGHPDTSGIDTIDYFISSRYNEPDNGQDNYTETLLKVPSLDTLSKRSTKSDVIYTRQDFQLPEDKKIYLVPMAIQKLHPDFDDILLGIIKRDENALIVLFNDYQLKSASDTLQRRILSKCPADKVLFLPWQPPERLYSLFELSDAVLSTIYFGAGTTGQFASSFGIPMVSLAGDYTRSRVLLGFYSLMGVEEAPVAYSFEEYIEIAYRVANDQAYHKRLSEQILEGSRLMFEENIYGEVSVKLYQDIMRQTLDDYR